MPRVHTLALYLGNSPAAKHAAPGQNLYLDDDGFLCQQFRRSLLDSQAAQGRFRSRVDIPELPPLDVRWTWIGQTAGVVFWERAGRVGAVGILLNGIECDRELDAAMALLGSRNLRVPDHAWDTLGREKKPVVLTLFYDLHTFTDPVAATAVPALANAMFTLFDTSG